MNIYRIQRLPESAEGIFPLKAALWETANVARVDHFLEESSDHRPATEVRLMYNAQGMYGLFKVKDRFVRCLHTHFQEPVYQDACVEFFVQPQEAKGYFNFEFNACGTLLASYVLNPERDSKGALKEFVPLTTDDLKLIKIRALFQKPIEPEISEPLDWELEFFISFNLLTRYIPVVAVEAGSRWRGNFYKCAENNSHPHWAAWSPVSDFNFHLPNCFGELMFGDSSVKD